MNTIHHPVMLDECLNHIPFSPQGIYLDCTFGGGGHSRGILARMARTARLYAIDHDDEAIARASVLASRDERIQYQHANFADVRGLCADWHITGKVNAVLADLGVSSPQLDDQHRGFAFRTDAELDMRMDRQTSPSAREWINQCGVDELRAVFKNLGQLRRPGALARTIVRYRQKQPITTTQQLADLIAAASPSAHGRTHPATNAFRAIRMHINHELDSLMSLLESLAEILVAGGRALLICFHSLEARAVKSMLRHQLPHKLPVRGEIDKQWQLIERVLPRTAEIEQNPRARSSSLYVIEKAL